MDKLILIHRLDQSKETDNILTNQLTILEVGRLWTVLNKLYIVVDM